MGLFDELQPPKIKKNEMHLLSSVPDGLMMKCSQCAHIYEKKQFKKQLSVCSHCSYHGRLAALERILLLTDHYQVIGKNWRSTDPLEFEDSLFYKDRLLSSQKKCQTSDAFVSVKGKLKALTYYLGVFEFRFMGGSMGCAVGEQIACLVEAALEDRLPVVIVSASGGARMQEGILSLMQMAKTTGLLTLLKKEKLPFISLLTDPTTGGVAASFAMLGDIILAEPGALIGFAGPRVIQQTMRQTLPEGFQRSEFLLQKGFVDRVVPREKLKEEIHQLMWHFGKKTCRFEDA